MKKSKVSLTIEYVNHDLAHYHDITQARAYFLLERQLEQQNRPFNVASGKWVWRWKITTNWQEIA